MEADIKKGLQDLYCFDYDNYGLDIEAEDDDPDWPDDLEEQREILEFMAYFFGFSGFWAGSSGLTFGWKPLGPK